MGQFTVFYSFYGELNINKNGKMGKKWGETLKLKKRKLERFRVYDFGSSVQKIL
jgi:hypothetical protein